MWLQTTREKAVTPVGSWGKDTSKAPVPAAFSISPDTWGKPQCGGQPFLDTHAFIMYDICVSLFDLLCAG